ncbi:hypothetical protein C0992_007625 [Termitomyces sp. T32_za158]|nr:hypothetical protein C0992_007625 [Termitomyces sp. T32_za158]
MDPLFRSAAGAYRSAVHDQVPLYVTVILDDLELAPSNSLLSDTLVIPSLVAAFSAGILLIHSFVNLRIYIRAKAYLLSETLITEGTDINSRRKGMRGHIDGLGGNAIFAYQVARLVGCLILTGLSFYRVGFRREVHDLAMSASIPHLSHDQLPPLSDYDYAVNLKAQSFPTRTLVRAEGIITQLIFEHSLRIRVKAETEASSPSTSSAPSTPITSDTDSIAISPSPHDDDGVNSHLEGLTGSGEVETLDSRDNTIRASPSSTKSSSSSKMQGKDTALDGGSKHEGSSSAENLVGKINNLVTTDMNNITEARDFLLTIIMKQELSASKVFSSMAVFDMLRDQLHMVFYAITQLVTGKVSLNRVDDFLQNTELLDAFSKKGSVDLFLQEGCHSDEIGFCDATFVWSNEPEGSLTPSKRNFVLRIEDELKFQRGQINLVIGPTGSGKTSLLMALLGKSTF